MKRGAGWVVGLGALTLLLAAWVTTAGSVPALRGVVPSPDAPTDNRVGASQQRAPSPRRQETRPGELPRVLDVFFTILLIVFALALLSILVRAVVLRRRRRRSSAGPIEPVPDAIQEGADGVVSERLSRSADEGLARLAEGDPRNAIVRCWTILEDNVVRTGLPRDPALTSEEFATQVLLRYAVTGSSIDELAGLYREARFSAHALDEGHRLRAVKALNSLRDDLDAAAHPAAGADAVSGMNPGQVW